MEGARIYHTEVLQKQNKAGQAMFGLSFVSPSDVDNGQCTRPAGVNNCNYICSSSIASARAFPKRQANTKPKEPSGSVAVTVISRA